MNVGSTLIKIGVTTLLISASFTASAETAKIAVASNFTATALKLQTAFEKTADHELLFSFGSTGKLTTQILYGAPFSAFLAADLKHINTIVAKGLASDHQKFTYAVGKLVLFQSSKFMNSSPKDAIANLKSASRIAIANPTTAPYGKAATETLSHWGMWEGVKPKIVQGNNVAQTYQFVMTGNADLGFVAKSQVIGAQPGTYWEIPEDIYNPIHQGAILLKSGEANEAAIAFLKFLKSEISRSIIAEHGYGLEG